MNAYSDCSGLARRLNDTFAGHQNEHSGFEGQAVRIELQEQRVYPETVQTHRHHVRPDVLPTLLRCECV